jgi:D-arabinan exo alpha-(1,3)/(1,5)-arabinofuranosidase (non-reducing end)
MKQISIIILAILLSPVFVFANGLDDLATIVDRDSLRASSFDRSGGNDDNVISFAPGDTHVMMDCKGPGRITHIWITTTSFPNHPTLLRDLVLRMYWENSPVPSVEAPLGDFFALGHGKEYNVKSVPICVGISTRALNCYWPMPFHKHARIEIHNNGKRSVRRIYYNIDYELGPIPPDQGLFHALYHREKQLKTQARTGNTTGADNYVILDTTGKGQYVGCCLFVDAQPGGWWGEGDEMIFIDGSELPTIIGTGSEDYFCNAWGFHETFCYPYYGVPLLEKKKDKRSITTAYRWHIFDPVRFSSSIRVTIEHLYGKKIVNDYSSIAYWYQQNPISQRELLPRGSDNHPRADTKESLPARFSLHGAELEEGLLDRGVKARSITTSRQAGFGNGGGWLKIETPKEQVEIPITVSEDGCYNVKVKPVNEVIKTSITLGLKGQKPKVISKSKSSEGKVPYCDLGTATSENKTISIVIGGQKILGIDRLIIEKIK